MQSRKTFLTKSNFCDLKKTGLENIKTILKGYNMIHVTETIYIIYKPSCPDKYRPKGMNPAKPYQVIAEKTVKGTKDGKEYEDIHFGFIDDRYELSFVAAFNCHVVVNDASGEPLQEYYRYINKTASQAQAPAKV